MRNLIINLRNFFDVEKMFDSPILPLSSPIERLLLATGLSRRTFFRACKERDESDKKVGAKEKLDDFEIDLVQRLAHAHFKHQDRFSVEKLTKEFNERITDKQCSPTTIWKTLKKLGFSYKKSSNRLYYQERADLVIAREKYLR